MVNKLFQHHFPECDEEDVVRMQVVLSLSFFFFFSGPVQSPCPVCLSVIVSGLTGRVSLQMEATIATTSLLEGDHVPGGVRQFRDMMNLPKLVRPLFFSLGARAVSLSLSLSRTHARAFH